MHRTLDVRRNRVAQRGQSCGWIGDDLGDDGLRARSRVRRLACQHLVEHAPQRKDVSALVDVVAGRLLGAHVGRSADRQSGCGKAVTTGSRNSARNSEVRDVHAAFSEQDVVRFDVPVDDAVSVRGLQRFADFLRNGQGILDRHLPVAIKPCPKRFPFDERHHVEEHAIRLARFEDGKDVRMRQAGRDLDLADEPVVPERRGELGPENLEGDLALVLDVLRQVDGRHAALTEFPLDHIAVGDRDLQAFWDLGQDLPLPSKKVQ